MLGDVGVSDLLDGRELEKEEEEEDEYEAEKTKKTLDRRRQ